MIAERASCRPVRIVVRGFTLIEVLVVLAITSLLLAIAIAVLGSARESANEARCATNLRGIGSALLLYSQANQNRFPPRVGSSSAALRHLAYQQLGPYSSLSEEAAEEEYLRGMWRCPSAPKEWMFSYGTNPNFWHVSLSAIDDPANFVLLRDRGGVSWPSDAGGADNTTIGSAWHKGRYNALYADGRVASVTREVLLDQLINNVPSSTAE
jgi:prepilin-type N-terminal cleavage/methylation domain-containing protein/prepilin-type processing-associated H-X9-DG protein